MGHLKILGLAAIATALALSVAAGSASATELDCGSAMCAPNSAVHAKAQGTHVFRTIIGNVECEETTLSATIGNTGNSAETVSGTLNSFTLTGCNVTVSVLKNGTVVFHTDTNDTAGTSGNGTLTWSDLEVTVELFGFHCIFTTNNTDIGTVTGSKTTKSTATLDVKAVIPRTGGRSGPFCGQNVEWAGSYVFDAPDTLNVT